MGEKKKHWNRRYYWAVAAAILLCVCLSVGGTYAYYTYNEAHKNTLSVGDVGAQVVETFSKPALTVGTTAYTKNVKVKNTGTSPAYIRVYMDFSTDAAKAASVLSGDGGSNYYSYSDFLSHLPGGWTYESSGKLKGYFYYTSALPAGSSTSALLTNVKTTYEKAADVLDYDIYVSAEAVQTLDKTGDMPSGWDWKAAWKEYLS